MMTSPDLIPNGSSHRNWSQHDTQISEDFGTQPRYIIGRARPHPQDAKTIYWLRDKLPIFPDKLQ